MEAVSTGNPKRLGLFAGTLVPNPGVNSVLASGSFCVVHYNRERPEATVSAIIALLRRWAPSSIVAVRHVGNIPSAGRILLDQQNDVTSSVLARIATVLVATSTLGVCLDRSHKLGHGPRNTARACGIAGGRAIRVAGTLVPNPGVNSVLASGSFCVVHHDRERPEATVSAITALLRRWAPSSIVAVRHVGNIPSADRILLDQQNDVTSSVLARVATVLVVTSTLGVGLDRSHKLGHGPRNTARARGIAGTCGSVLPAIIIPSLTRFGMNRIAAVWIRAPVGDAVVGVIYDFEVVGVATVPGEAVQLGSVAVGTKTHTNAIKDGFLEVDYHATVGIDATVKFALVVELPKLVVGRRAEIAGLETKVSVNTLLNRGETPVFRGTDLRDEEGIAVLVTCELAEPAESRRVGGATQGSCRQEKEEAKRKLHGMS